MTLSRAILAFSLTFLGMTAAAETQDKPPTVSSAATATNAFVKMLLPGFTVRELPVKLSNINNVEYAPDGRLFAAGYDGRFHLLRDTDGDGLEDKVDTFWSESSENYPLGMVVRDGAVYTVLTDEVVRFRDTDGDGIPDQRETVVKGFDDPEMVKAPYLMHRRVDSSMALTFGPDGSLYITMGNGAPGSAYWQDKDGLRHYSTDRRRGCLLKIGKDGKVEQLATGLRYIMSLQWNKQGDLFGTDQEGATWVPNGNPFDELLHIQPGRHYGFPPYHPLWLTNVIDEPSVWDYEPQHESTCGFRFNGPLPGRGRFGPGFWADNALITGEARGKLWRTVLAKTAAGYVGKAELFARLTMLTIDCAISPKGDLVVCCHSGDPDWGNGPKGEGRLFKISFTDHQAPQPVLTWALNEKETVVAFDRRLDPKNWVDVGTRTKVIAGKYVDAGDRFEKIRPGYEVVKLQQLEKTVEIPVRSSRIGPDGHSLIFETATRANVVHYEIAVQNGSKSFDISHTLAGLEAAWVGRNKARWSGWLPHPDFVVAREFTHTSSTHDDLWREVKRPGTLTLTTQLDLWQMLIPATQPISKLDYVPEPETVTLVFKSDAELSLICGSNLVDRVEAKVSRLTIKGPEKNRWLPLKIELATPATKLEVSYHTTRDPRPRALATRRFIMPFATPDLGSLEAREIPELSGGNWVRGRDLFRGKATCITCHQLRGEGAPVGPDLSNLVHRDYVSVLKDIVEPSASIHPDAVGYLVKLKNGEEITGTRFEETSTELQLALPGGNFARLKKESILSTEAMKTSLMPAGLEKALSNEELRDLMTYLLIETQPKSK